jgi:hypothetical protein
MLLQDEHVAAHAHPMDGVLWRPVYLSFADLTSSITGTHS